MVGVNPICLDPAKSLSSYIYRRATDPMNTGPESDGTFERWDNDAEGRWTMESWATHPIEISFRRNASGRFIDSRYTIFEMTKFLEVAEIGFITMEKMYTLNQIKGVTSIKVFFILLVLGRFGGDLGVNLMRIARMRMKIDMTRVRDASILLCWGNVQSV